jgi:hypothetical protein
MMRLKAILLATASFVPTTNLAAQCCENGDLPNITQWTSKGTAQQDHYIVGYQSGFGKDKLVYRLRNENAKLKTPVSWTDGKHVLVSWSLPPQSDGKWKACPTRVCFDGPTKRSTLLSYGGPNSDECKETVGAYVPPERKKGWWSLFPLLGVSLKGGVADVEGDAEFNVDIAFSSEVSRNEKTKRTVITYKLDFGKDGVRVPFATGGADGRNELYVTWARTEKGAFGDKLANASREGSESIVSELNADGEIAVKEGVFALRRGDRVLAAIRGEYYVRAGGAPAARRKPRAAQPE